MLDCYKMFSMKNVNNCDILKKVMNVVSYYEFVKKHPPFILNIVCSII